MVNKNLTLEDLKYKSSLIGSYEFYFGNLYFLHCQENGVPHCLMRLIVGLSSVCSGNLFLNGKLLDTKQKTQLSCYVGGNMQYTWYRRPMTVHSQLKKGLANLKNQELN